MNVISKRGLEKLIEARPQAEAALQNWYKLAKRSSWTSLADVRENVPSADMVGEILIFNILHNELRLITVASWNAQRIYVKALMTHKEYNRKEWMRWE